MASRQRSFFNQKPQKRQQWHRFTARDSRDSNQLYDHPAVQTTKAPPIPASLQSKLKLGAFQYTGSSSLLFGAGVENVTEQIDGGKGNATINRKKKMTTEPGKLQKEFLEEIDGSIGDHGGVYPQTPAGRVPLAELVNNSEDVFDQTLALTPADRVLWNQSPNSSTDSAQAMTPVAIKGRKRARSSSPASSSQDFAAFPPAVSRGGSFFDHQPPQQSIKTPHADPAGDLWSRYSVRTTEKETPSKRVPLALNFPSSSSPHTPARRLFRNDTSRLRRTMSCGMEWPTSVTKRRKIVKSGSQLNNGLSYSAPQTLIEVRTDEKVSRVSYLLERLRDGFFEQGCAPGNEDMSAIPQLAINESSDAYSSPTDRCRLEAAKNKSAASFIDQELKGQLSSTSGSKRHSDDSVQLPENNQGSSFGYCDNEYDFDSIDTTKDKAEISNSTAGSFEDPTPKLQSIPEINEVSAMKNYQQSADQAGIASSLLHKSCGTHEPPEELTQANRAQIVSADNHGSDDDDDFGEVDDADMLAADLEVVTAMYDQKLQRDDLSDHHYDGKTKPHGNSSFAATKCIDVSSVAAVGMEKRKAACVELSSDDEFGNDIDFEEIAAEYSLATQASQVRQQTHNNNRASTIQRYLIMTVAESQYITNEGHSMLEKVLLLQEEKSKTTRTAMLRQSWFDSPCTPGSYVHVLGNFDKAGQCIIDDAHNIVILHPDHLISATVVADSFSCTRRAVLQDRVKATNEASEPQVYGQILHEVFQQAMRANRWDSEWLQITIQNIVARYLETLFEINVETQRAVEHLLSKMPELQSWAKLFVAARPQPGGVIKDRNGVNALMSVNKLLDVEEHVWSPKYGLKGNIDATVQVVMQEGKDEATLTVPFEIKTGKNTSNAAHNAQTALYTLLLSDRYDVEIAYGILYYMETSEISRIPAIRNELRHMIMQRNELACYVRHRLELPPMLKRPHLCGRCYAKTTCFIYHKLVDNGDGETSGMKEKLDQVVQHLQPVHQDFFRKWDNLLTKEETDILKFRRELWTMLSSEREKVGRCFGDVVIEAGSAVELTDASKINRFRYTFVQQTKKPDFSFADSQIGVGEPIVISDEEGHYALANGYVTQIRKQRITVAVDRQLHNARAKGKGFHPQKNQTFIGIMEVVTDGSKERTSEPEDPQAPALYRIDKDEFSNGMATVRNNLVRIMERDGFAAQSLRKLIIEGSSPKFVRTIPAMNATQITSQTNLNIDQKNAIQKVMSANDYALVLGMPGTGKTTTIAHIIRALAAQGKSILLTSYTHTAVDNILMKIREYGIGILRLGAVAKVHPEVQEFADLAGIPKSTVEELRKSYNNQVVATTCLGINHPIFSQRIFDYCIVDEASQITLPVCLGPIRMARTFILVGDHYQLPPLVQNKEAQEGGLDVSLFKLLSDGHPSSVVNLEHQYRMCEDIMSLSNNLIYDGRLKCGTPAVAQSEITIPNMAALTKHHYSPANLSSFQAHFCPGPGIGGCWIRDLLDPSVKVAFVNTDPLLPLSREIARGSRITNPIEASITTQLVLSLLAVGVDATNIGVITLYRSQLALLKQNLRHGSSGSSCGNQDTTGAVEMHTADKFQGRDKDVVVLSLVRSNDIYNVGDLLKDWRRVNVALTRARTKLLIIGSWETISKGNELLNRLCQLVDQRGWRVDLKKHDLEAHIFEDGITQMSVKSENAENTKVSGCKGGNNKKSDRGYKSPEKKKGLDARTILGKRPVLRDIINEATG